MREASSMVALVILGAALAAGCGGARPPAEDGASQVRPTAGPTDSVDLATPLPCPIDPASLDPIFPVVRWSAADAPLRRGQGAERCSDVPSSKEVPLEACGARRSYEFIARLACDDGSLPLPGLAEAQESRAGSLGPGGRCGGIIDLYVVPCPEGEYQVFVDMYHCGPGEEIM